MRPAYYLAPELMQERERDKDSREKLEHTNRRVLYKERERERAKVE